MTMLLHGAGLGDAELTAAKHVWFNSNLLVNSEYQAALATLASDCHIHSINFR